MRKLARLYGVSTPTMHAAIQGLATLGLVRISLGVGVFVAHPRSGAALLNHAFQNATPMELAMMRAAIDEQMPVVVAKQVAAQPDSRQPMTLSDISFLAHERSSRRIGFPHHFLMADAAFHRTIASSVRGTEITPGLYDQIGRRLLATLMSVADVQAADAQLDGAHLELAAAILAGRPHSTARLARAIARRELRSLEQTLG